MILNVGIGVKRNRSHVVDTFHGLAVQGFNVGERVSKTQAGDANFVRGQSVKHEGIVGVGTVSDRDFALAFGDGRGRVFGSGGEESHD